MRILIAGLGAIGQRHARNLRAIWGDGLELLAYRRRGLPFVVTDTLERDDSRNVESELDLAVFHDLDEALASKPDAVFVCTPSSLHLEVAQRAAIDYGEHLQDWHRYEDYRTSYAARADMGGGVALTQIHDYDLAWWLFGAPRTVTASGGHLSTLEIDVEDTVDAVLEGDFPVRIRQCFATRPPYRRVTVVGERGTATVDLIAARATTDAHPASTFLAEHYQRNQMFLDLLRHFRNCLEGRERPAISLETGAAVLQVVLAVKNAMRTGARVEV